LKTYQTLALIGGILGILGTIALSLTLSLFSIGVGSLVNMTSHFPTTSSQEAQQQAQNQQNYLNTKAGSDRLVTGLAFAFLFYIVCIVITFVIKNTKILGTILITLGVIAVPITNGWGIISFALLLPAGIVAIRYKEKEITA
jgi:hypothetical protein